MKKIKLLLLLLMLGTASAYSQLQQIKIVSFTVKNQLPAVIDNWGNTPGSLLLVAQLPPNVSVKGIRLMVQIKGGGAIICSNNSAGGMQVDEFTTRTFSANELTGTLQGCHDLKDGSYSICVQFFNIDRVAISNEVCKEFSVEAPREIEYNPPTLINPENGKVFTEAELSRPVNFRWTPLVPKPRDPVTYRLKVWQLMQGQNSTEAMRSSQPIVTKDVDNITQAVVNGIYTGPCRPPYLCEYVWQVQSLNREGKPIGKNEGRSEAYTFKVETNTTTSTAPQLVSPNEGKAFTANEMSAPVIFRWTPVVPKPQSVTYRLKVWQLMQGQSGAQAMRTNQPIVTKDVDNITQAVVNGLYTGPCRPPYLCEFVWQVQAVNRENQPVGNNDGKSELWSFVVKENSGGTITNSSPENAKQFSPDDAKSNISFRWTPLVPKPQEPVTYRLKVWQLMQGQNGTQAMRSNQPIVTKDVDNITQANVASILRSGCTSGPCCPPYLCDFIWNVEALILQPGATPKTVATSEPTEFNVKQNEPTAGECSPSKLEAPANAKSFAPKDASGGISFRWTPVVPKPRDPVVYRLKVWQLMQGQNGTQAMRENKPIVTKDCDNITEATIGNIYTGPCRPPYLCEFIWEVQALNREGKPICSNEGKSEAFTFKVEDNATTCSPPKLESPANAKSFSPKDATGGISFRWTPVVPKPRDPVVYRLKVWQLMQGQNGTQAMRENKPIVTKDCDNITEATISNIYTGPCKPPYLCEFVWEVQALTREGKPACDKNEGRSETFSFKIQNNIDIQIDSLKVGCCEKGVQSIYIKVRNNLATPVKVVAIKYKVNGAGAAITFTPSPTLPQTIAGNGFVVFNGFIECNPAINFLKFLVDAEDVADPDNKETEVKSDTLNCICNACKDIKIQPNEKDKPTVTSTAITQNISFVTGPAKVKSVKMDLVWFEFVPESDDCLVCTTPSAQMGNFSSGTLNGTGGSGGGTHALNWNFSPPKDMNGGVPLQYNISYPKLVACCGAKAKWCIRYTVTYENCITCSVVVCYEAAIKGCNK
ncbi:MAG: hypothetical protein IPF72_04660 [Chitinophagaceae bacterium]|nr:hypothetical protein [Chitinophagaceae bacterium]